MVNVTKFGTRVQILIAPHTAVTIGCQVNATGVTADDDGDYVIKAGTPLYGDADPKLTRDTVLSISGTTAYGVCLNDVKVNAAANGTVDSVTATLVIQGTVDYLKLDEDVQALVDAATLDKIDFVKGDED